MIVEKALQFAGETNRGLVRSRNEDNFCLCCRKDADAVLAVVADGIGGHRDGDVASFLCCRELLMAWRKSARHCRSLEDARGFLKRELLRINTLIHDAGGRQDVHMGCTVVAAVLLPEYVVVAFAGDSRLYLQNGDGTLQMLTKDHTLLAELEESGRLIEGNAAERIANVISKAVGTRRFLEPEIRCFQRPERERYLFCTDGLYRYVPMQKTEEILRHAEDARSAVDLLMREALLAGAPDNVTVICGVPQK